MSRLGSILTTLALASSLVTAFPGMTKARQASPNGERAEQQQSPPGVASSPRGLKLVLKDGTYQLVREYKIEGDRVRYYSLDRSQWEEIPTSLVDWAQTKKMQEQEEQAGAALVKKATHQEAERQAMPLSVDASLEVAKGVFLPPGEGVWVFNNKAVLQLPPAEPIYKTNKRHEVEKVLSPIPIVSTRHSVLLKGRHARIRIQTGEPEFYVRTRAEAPPPELQLVEAQTDGSRRKVGRVDQLFKMETATTRPLSIERWQIAGDVYRYTLGQGLKPGEYALVEVIPGSTELDQLSLYVWDFGVDAGSAETANAK